MPGRTSLRWNTGSAVVRPAPAGGPLAPGVRASPGTVGFLGSEGSLTLLNYLDPLGPLAADAEWQGGALRINTAGFTLSGYKLTCPTFSTSGSYTVNGCVIDALVPGINAIYNASGAGTMTVRDTTVRATPDGDGSVAISALNNAVNAYRCDVSGYEDCIGLGGGTIDQCYLHNLDDAGVDPHNDVIQHYPGSGAGALTVTNCYLVCSGTSGGEAAGATACLTFDTDSGGVARNNYLFRGGYFFRIEGGTNVTFENNNFGPLTTQFGLVAATGGYSILSWSNNRDANNDLVPSP